MEVRTTDGAVRVEKADEDNRPARDYSVLRDHDAFDERGVQAHPIHETLRHAHEMEMLHTEKVGAFAPMAMREGAVGGGVVLPVLATAAHGSNLVAAVPIAAATAAPLSPSQKTQRRAKNRRAHQYKIARSKIKAKSATPSTAQENTTVPSHATLDTLTPEI